MGKSGTGLTYRGYDIQELADGAQFEEVAYLLLKGELPDEQQLEDYKRTLRSLRTLPAALLEVLERIPADAHPMDVLRTGCSMLGDLEPEDGFEHEHEVADRLLAAFRAFSSTGTSSATTGYASPLTPTRSASAATSWRCCTRRRRANWSAG